jgi:hypothetical protein
MAQNQRQAEFLRQSGDLFVEQPLLFVIVWHRWRNDFIKSLLTHRRQLAVACLHRDSPSDGVKPRSQRLAIMDAAGFVNQDKQCRLKGILDVVGIA